MDTETLESADKEQIKYDIAVLEEERDRLKKICNLDTIRQYREKESEYQDRLKELEKATDVRNTCREKLEDLRKKRLDEFMAGFARITLKLKEMYQMITLGGDAELELVDSLDPFSEGVVFSVRPPKKSWKHIANLSGWREDAVVISLGLRAAPLQAHALYVMDEIDAALDYKNVSIIANYIKDRCTSAQFVIISLRNNMFELARRLTGVYKTHNVTKTITISPSAFAATLSGLRRRPRNRARRRDGNAALRRAYPSLPKLENGKYTHPGPRRRPRPWPPASPPSPRSARTARQANMALSSASCAARAFASMVTIMGSSRCSPFLLGSWSGPRRAGSIFPELVGAAALLGSFSGVYHVAGARGRLASLSVCAAWLFLCGELVVALAVASRRRLRLARRGVLKPTEGASTSCPARQSALVSV